MSGALNLTGTRYGVELKVRATGAAFLAYGSNGPALFFRYRDAKTYRDDLRAHGMGGRIVKLTVTYKEIQRGKR